ncbi:MAG: MBOAT family O-acyltransferase [Bacteroidota bacterium]
MLFNSFEFLFFLPLMVGIYYLTNFRYRWLVLLLGSYYFYASAEPYLLILLLISTVTDYICGIKMHSIHSKQRKKVFLFLSIFINLGLLFWFKYLSFFKENLNQFLVFLGTEPFEDITQLSYTQSNILLPIGISFYTFQTMSYSIDVYRSKIVPERHFGKFALYVAFFPQLVAGPIERASRLLPQLKQKVLLNVQNLRKGLIYVAWGLFLKVVVADRLGVYVDEVFNNTEIYQGIPLFLGYWFFSFQIYYDFSAYTAIAIGAAKTMGIDLIHNFNRPFFISSGMQFWQRWHISLMNWIRDYMYQPLVKKAKVSRIIAVLLVFFIVGLWHGANWTFVLWGVLNGLFLILEVSTKPLRNRFLKVFKLPKQLILFLGGFIVLNFVALTSIFFRSQSFSHAVLYFENLVQLPNLHFDILGNYFELALCFMFIFIVQTVHYFKGNNKIHDLVLGKTKLIRWSIYLVYIGMVVLFAINRQNNFIYFQF